MNTKNNSKVDYSLNDNRCIHCRLWRVNHWYIIAYGDPINGTAFDNEVAIITSSFALQELYVIALFYIIYSLY